MCSDSVVRFSKGCCFPICQAVGIKVVSLSPGKVAPSNLEEFINTQSAWSDPTFVVQGLRGESTYIMGNAKFAFELVTVATRTGHVTLPLVGVAVNGNPLPLYPKLFGIVNSPNWPTRQIFWSNRAEVVVVENL